MKKSIMALALGTFALGMAEFQMMGILTALSGDLGISVAKGGHLISAYAAGVCVGAPALIWLRKMPLKRVILLLSMLIVVGNLLATLSGGFAMLMVGRFISGLPHGAYFGVGAIVARKLADKGKEVMAVSLMIAGMTVATLIGVPIGTFLSTYVTWRMAFLLVTVSGVATLIAVRRCVPDVGSLPDTGFKGQFRFLRTLPPWLIFGGVIFGQIGLYCWYSYIDPLLLNVTGFGEGALSWLMIVAGAGMFAGNLVAGRVAVRHKPSAVAACIMGIGAIVLAMVYFFGQIQWLMVMLLFVGTASLFGSGSPLQSSIVGYSKGGEMLGGTCIQIAYNAGNAIAAAIGSSVIAAGGGYREPSLIGIPIVLVGCVLLTVLYIRNERAAA
ncbi:MAG: MFS transporter [Muribaculaceae bacterium]|nr:MFS transporter [Muribaculaceae bacterium]